ncbi:MarR family winged helix-turn-helix transcriptional regulator [Echinicola sediminis]
MAKSDFDLGYQNQHIESKIIAGLERISQAYRVLLWEESKVHGMSPIQVQVLIFLLFHQADTCTVSYLAKEFNMSKPTISDTVKSLHQKQLIEKVYSSEDSRSYKILLTERGRQLANNSSHFTKELKKPLESLQEKEKAALLSSLFHLIRHLNKAGIISLQRMCFSCQYYQDREGEHYCALLKMRLEDKDLRMDCPEHVLKA